LVRAWLAKAQSDLGTARKLANGPDTYLDTAIYHCQQAAEKAIKALLVQNDLRFEKTHDLEVLIQRATPAAPTLENCLIKLTGSLRTPSHTGILAKNSFRLPRSLVRR
jgi:HEPN domain-containing protein